MQFSFYHNTHTLLPFLLQVRQYVQKQLPAGNYDAEQVLNKSKFIITELCTNAIKHSGETHSGFAVYITNNHLIIERKDKGHPFKTQANNIQLTPPFSAAFDIVTLTEDDINRLNMQRINAYSARFYVEAVLSKQLLNGQKLNEHFGLIIICRSSTSFTYTYDIEAGMNVFTANIELV